MAYNGLCAKSIIVPHKIRFVDSTAHDHFTPVRSLEIWLGRQIKYINPSESENMKQKIHFYTKYVFK